MSCKIIPIVFNLPTVFNFFGGGDTHELYWKVIKIFFFNPYNSTFIFRRNSCQSSPNGENQIPGMDSTRMNVKEGEYLENNQQLNFPPPSCQLDHPPFDPVGIDPVHFDYSNQIGIPSSMDSPNFNMDYTQVLFESVQISKLS